MISDNNYKILKKCAWILFFILLALSLADLILEISEDAMMKTLPFKQENGLVIETTDDSLLNIFENKIITKIDTFEIKPSSSETEDGTESGTGNLDLFRSESSISLADLILAISEDATMKTLPFKQENGLVVETTDDSLLNTFENKIITKIDTFEIKPSSAETEDGTESGTGNLDLFRSESSRGIQINVNSDYQKVDGDSVEVVLKDTLTDVSEHRYIKTDSELNRIGIISIAGNLALMVFAFFNAFLLLKYSSAKENILIVYFVLFLITPSPSSILTKPLLYIWAILLSPFWGILFYHFMVLKAEAKKNIKKLYLVSTIIFVIGYILSIIIKESFDFIHIWSAWWMLKGFLLLRKEYKKTRSIELRRLWGAFSGIGVSMISIILIFAIAVVIALFAGISSLTGLSMLIKSYSEILGILIAIIVLIPILGVFLGFLWFLGSFTWSLLTGTAMGVKIRSTLIYTITGVFFVVIFGLIDYSLGEILQGLFGKFVGSEFIAGIPITIGMIALFNPVRNKIEKLVDGKLNTSELDFLEKTESFTNNISEEGVLEGFEEYICENLMQRLKLTKVALISYEKEMKAYKYNEIRGSDVIENSKVDDVHLVLLENKIQRNYSALNEDPQEVSSFSLIVPIIHDPDHKWFLALGEKSDKSLYNKKDEQALVQLTERIKLSLKFILAYEEIVAKKYHQTIAKHEKMMEEKDEMIRMLKTELKKTSI